jgi:hypothetical protein
MKSFAGVWDGVLSYFLFFSSILVWSYYLYYIKRMGMWSIMLPLPRSGLSPRGWFLCAYHRSNLNHNPISQRLLNWCGWEGAMGHSWRHQSRVFRKSYLPRSSTFMKLAWLTATCVPLWITSTAMVAK